jgi:hypothetical protein
MTHKEQSGKGSSATVEISAIIYYGLISGDRRFQEWFTIGLR